MRHVVVFDVNVYLDVARCLGAPFSWARFDECVASQAKLPVPHPTETALDSLRAIAVCVTGRFAGDDPLEVWTNAHIDSLVRGKACDPVDAVDVNRRGLGWSANHAQELVDDLIAKLLQRSNGGSLGNCFPDGNPPLDHEDGMVFGACRILAGDDPLSRVFCVTRDKGFLAAYRDGRLPSHSTVIVPSAFLAMVRAARFHVSARAMKA